jgi:hypothetical protein
MVDGPGEPVDPTPARSGKQRREVSPEAMELIQAMDRSLVTPARSESGFPGPLALPVDVSSNILSGGFQAVCAGRAWLPLTYRLINCKRLCVIWQTALPGGQDPMLATEPFE